MKPFAKQVGLTLLEVLIALTIGLVILLGVTNILMNSSMAYRMQDSLIRLQTNGQFATEFLTKDLRNAGFWGCVNDLSAVNNQLTQGGGNNNAIFYGFAENIAGSDNPSNNSIIQAADTLIARGAASINSGTTIKSPFIVSQLNVGINSGIESGDILFVSDCEQGDIFQASNITVGGIITHNTTGTPGNVGTALSKLYDDEAYIYQAYTHVYTVDVDANNNPGLYLTDAYGSTLLVPDVEGMVVLYGEDTDGDGSANRYVRASNVTSMGDVVSLRISLLLRSQEDNLSPTPQTYTFNGATTTATDQRLHRVYTTTILLRNRGV